MASKGSFGGSVKLTGETEYKKALREITDNLTVLSSEMKVVSNAFGKNENSISSLNQKNDILKKKLDEQNKALEESKKMLNEARNSTDSNASTIKKWETALNNAKAEVNKTTREISDNENTIKKMEKANVSNTQELRKFEKAEEDASKSSLKLGDIIKGNLISEAVIGGIKALGSAVKGLAANFSEWEEMSNALKEQEAKVAQVMKNTTDATDEDIQAMIDLTAAKEKVGVVSQETQLAGLQELGTYVENKETLEALLPVMNDMIAQQYGIGASMESASGIATMMGKVLGNGQVDALSRLGYKFDETQEKVLKFGTEEEKTAMLAEVIQQSVGGMNEALAQTDAGKVAIATSYVDDMKKSVGGLVAETKNGLLAQFLPAIQEMSTALSNMVNGNLSIDEGMQKITDGILIGLDTITELLPKVLETGLNIIGKLIEGIIQAIPDMMPAITQVIMTLISNLVSSLPSILQTGITILLELVKGITQALPDLIPVAIQAIMDLVNTMLDNIDEIIECGIELLVALTEGIMNALPELIARLPEIIIKITSKLIELSPQLLSAALRIIMALAEGLIKYIPEMISRIPQIIKSMINAFKESFGDFKNIGNNMLKGLWEGMSNTLEWLKNKIKGLVGNVTKFIKNLFGIHSPSTLFRDEIGTNLALGIGEGFDDTMSDVSRDMASAIPTDFDAITNVHVGSSLSSNQLDNRYDYSFMVNAFKEALKDVKVVMNDREFGTFVTDTMERVVYS